MKMMLLLHVNTDDNKDLNSTTHIFFPHIIMPIYSQSLPATLNHNGARGEGRTEKGEERKRGREGEREGRRGGRKEGGRVMAKGRLLVVLIE